jgi:hypothetical protein
LENYEGDGCLKACALTMILSALAWATLFGISVLLACFA